MSELSLGQLKGLTVNNNVISVPAGHTLKQGGSIIQVVQATTTTAQTFNAGSPDNKTFYDIAGLSITFTPKFANSKILLEGSISVGNYVNAYNAFLRFSRDGAGVGTSNSLGNGFQAAAGFRCAVDAQPGSISMNYLDSSNTVLPITYKVQICNTGGSSYPAYVNRSSQTSAWEAGMISTFTIMEVMQ